MVSADVFYTSLGMSLFGPEEPNFRRHASVATTIRKRILLAIGGAFIAIALRSLADVEQGAEELRRSGESRA